jgi:hypothetical protein
MCTNQSTMSLDTSFPSWTLYYHSSNEPKWGIGTFENLGPMGSWSSLFQVLEGLKVDTLSEGMFFLMRDPIPPLWENFKNIYGGAYSFRVLKRDAGEAFVTYAVAAMLGSIMSDPANVVNGLSISTKKTHNIIKVWNADSAKYRSPSELYKLLPDMKTEDILYTPFTEKRMS